MERGADVKVRDNKNSRPLHVASRRGPADVVELLLRKGAQPNAHNDRCWTPLHIASQEGAVNFVQCLLAQGADVNVEDGDRRTPLHLASNNKAIRTAQLLTRHGDNVYARNKDGQIPFSVVPSASAFRGRGGRATARGGEEGVGSCCNCFTVRFCSFWLPRRPRETCQTSGTVCIVQYCTLGSTRHVCVFTGYVVQLSFHVMSKIEARCSASASPYTARRRRGDEISDSLLVHIPGWIRRQLRHPVR
jgi:hypothetical protein